MESCSWKCLQETTICDAKEELTIINKNNTEIIDTLYNKPLPHFALIKGYSLFLNANLLFVQSTFLEVNILVHLSNFYYF